MTDIHSLSAAEARDAIPALGALLHAAVHAGASVNFVLPFETAQAEAWWRGAALPGIESGATTLFVARGGAGEGGEILGCVLLMRAPQPNQPHRAEAGKLLVHPSARRRGLARALMAALEGRAAAEGRTLITLDTRTGDMAEPLYSSMGYETVGVIPGFCVDPIHPGKLDGTTIMYKRLL
ncbi:GNAT family N-acetyltransferase [Rhodovulum sp. DZ06]|uniref:GNAT family N-acetyltransferase n=1 Tax=Rhodovulum sp. DZ06 TaxID=3425126 RepID=UPI003D34FBDB